MSSSELVVLDQARVALEQAQSVAEVLDVHDKAAALQAYAKSAKLGLEAQNKAAEWKLRAQRKAGELLAMADLQINQYAGGSDSLSEANITHHDSSRWQKLARVPEHEFEDYLASATEDGIEITQAAALRLLPKPTTTQSQTQPARFATAFLNRGKTDLGSLEFPGSTIPSGATVRLTVLATCSDTIHVGDRLHYVLTPTDTAVTAWYAPKQGIMYDGREERSLNSAADIEEPA